MKITVYSVFGFDKGFVGTHADCAVLIELHKAAVEAARNAWPENPSSCAGGLGSFPGAAHEHGVYLALVCPGQEAEKKIADYLWVDRPFAKTAYQAVIEAGIRLDKKLTDGLASAKKQWLEFAYNPDAWRVINVHENSRHIAWDFEEKGE
jgi:hypothetical protein